MTFTPFESTIGGILIGVSAAAYLKLNGRISGMSGALTGTLKGTKALVQGGKYDWFEYRQKVAYLLGLVTAGFLVYFIPGLAPEESFVPLGLSVRNVFHIPALVTFIGGMLVAIGTNVGSGCTSGHMICGIARLSRRSFVATATFSSVAFIVVQLGTPSLIVNYFFGGHMKQLSHNQEWISFPSFTYALLLLSILAIVLATYYYLYENANQFSQSVKNQMDQYVLPYYSALVFGLGLAFAGMTSPAKVVGFFDFFGDHYDPSLFCVAVGAILLDLYLFQMHILPAANKGETPLYHDQYHLPSSTQIDWKLVTGAAIFGVGWGLGGVCPGPVMTNLGTFNPLFILYCLGFYTGLQVKEHVLQI